MTTNIVDKDGKSIDASTVQPFHLTDILEMLGAYLERLLQKT
jgi:hypothetical protein